MRSFVSAIIGIAACSLVTSPSFATTYDFSDNIKTWDQTILIDGWFDGTANGNLIVGLSDISVFINGVAFSSNGSLFDSAWYGNSWHAGNGYASFDGTQNNFLFIDTNFPTYQVWNNYLVDVSNAFSGYIASGAGAYGPRTWNVYAVPEPTTFAVMGLALLGLMLVRYRNVTTLDQING